MVTSKHASRLSGLTLAVGLGVAVSTGHGVAAAEPSDPGGAPSNPSSDASNPSSAASSDASPKANETSPPSVGGPDGSPSDDSLDKDDNLDKNGDTTTGESADAVTEPESTDEQPQLPGSGEGPADPDALPPPAAPLQPTAPADHGEAMANSNDGQVRAAMELAPTREPRPTARTVQNTPAEAGQRGTIERTVTTDPPQPVAVQSLSANGASPTAAAAAAPAAIPAPAVARTPVGPLTGLLALFGLTPAAPGTPVTPLSQLIELIWVATRRIEYTFLNQTPRATTPTLTAQDPVTGEISGTVGAFDPDPEDQLTYTVVDNPDHGTVAVNADGTFTYTPDPAWAHATAGTDTFTVRASDAANGFRLHLFSWTDSVTVPVTVQVGRINQAPSITASPTTPNPDPITGSITYTVAARDPENDQVTVTVSQPAHGVVTRNADGTFTYTPDQDFAHALSRPGSAPVADTITFTATDRHNAAGTAIVHATITPLNDDPVVHMTLPSVDLAGNVTIQLSVTDADGDTVKMTLPDPVHGAFTSVTITDENGDTVTVTPGPGLQLDLSPSDAVTIVYRPDRVAGAPVAERLTFVGDDGHGGTTETSIPAPIAIGNVAPTITIGGPTVVDATTGAVRYTVTVSDPDGDSFVLTVSDPAHGVLVRNADGSYTYTPDAAYAHSLSAVGNTNPAADEIRFIAVDQLGATTLKVISVPITPRNTAPHQVGATPPSAPDADGTVTGRVIVEDNEIDPITLTASSTKGTVTVDGNGNFTFDPSAQARQQAAAIGARPDDTKAVVVITATDGHGGTLRMEVTVNVLPAAGNTITFADGVSPRDVFVVGNVANRIYVLAGDELRIVDTTTRTLVGTIELGATPMSIAVSADARYVYVGKTDFTGTTVPVTKIDTQTGAATPIGGVRQPSAMALSADGATLFVTNYQDGTVSVINTATGGYSTIDTALQSDAVAVSGGTLYVGRIINDVRVVNVATGGYTDVVVGPFDGVTGADLSIAVAGQYVYVTDGLNDKLAVIDSETNTVIARVTVGDRPSSAAVSPGGAFVFVANRGGDSVSVIDTETGTVATTIPVGHNPTNIDINADGTRLYVTTAEGISVVPIENIYFLYGTGGDDDPGWSVGAGTGTGGGPVLPPVIPVGPGGPTPTPVIPGGTIPITL
jgi:YVTN family beta-propeller protein/VCBS repeat-containing protein